MRYSIKGSWRKSLRSPTSDAPREVAREEPAASLATRNPKVDAETLKLALDQLAHQVLQAGRPLPDAWEHLRKDLLEADLGR